MLENLLKLAPYSLPSAQKTEAYGQMLSELTKFHYQHCEPYRKILDLLPFNPEQRCQPEAYPFLPVRLFKELQLTSVADSRIAKTLHSSGTTGKQSTIVLDQETALTQSKVLTKLMSSLLGSTRLPMLLIEQAGVVTDRNKFSARAAGVLGFSMLGTDITYALKDDLTIATSTIQEFCERHGAGPVIIFGFTSSVWSFLQKLKAEKMSLTFPQGILIHGGGWKRMQDQAVDDKIFKQSVQETCGIKRVHNYYGMVEQTGSIFLECEQGYLHCSIFSDVMIRNKDFSLCERNEPGMIQLLSPIPKSYPGHLILSEDLGELIGEDDCRCGRLGKYFKVLGRLKQAELRGCSDSYG